MTDWATHANCNAHASSSWWPAAAACTALLPYITIMVGMPMWHAHCVRVGRWMHIAYMTRPSLHNMAELCMLVDC